MKQAIEALLIIPFAWLGFRLVDMHEIHTFEAASFYGYSAGGLAVFGYFHAIGYLNQWWSE